MTSIMHWMIFLNGADAETHLDLGPTGRLRQRPVSALLVGGIQFACQKATVRSNSSTCDDDRCTSRRSRLRVCLDLERHTFQNGTSPYELLAINCCSASRTPESPTEATTGMAWQRSSSSSPLLYGTTCDPVGTRRGQVRRCVGMVRIGTSCARTCGGRDLD